MELSPDRIMAIGGGYGPSKVLLTAVGLGLFTELGDEAMTAEAIADRLGLLKRPAIDFLDALVSLDLLARDGDGPGSHYRNTPETAHFLDEARPTYAGGLLKIWNERNYRFWADLTEALKTGKAQSEVKQTGRPFFEALYADPRRLEAFMAAMDAASDATSSSSRNAFRSSATGVSVTWAARTVCCHESSRRLTRTCSASASTCPR